ncbi:MAG: HDOD domain-containing protein [Rhodocyclaceae bacterium]|jgi:EAL and modified HD-GYP domain-containing signal transduction protein|nr:HDOD domain-containing protein [Rhodocyclaceae bacterium]
MDTNDRLPLITFQPAVDFNSKWVALLLESTEALDGSALAALFAQPGCSEILATLPCVAAVDPDSIDPSLAADLPPGRFILRIPVAAAADAAAHERLAGLQSAGFGLMADGFPPAGATLLQGIDSLAVACPGHAMPAGFGDWLRALPGPHLALGTTEHVCPGFCKFHWLAGHLPGQHPIQASSDPTTRSLLLRLLALVMQDADADELEILIRRDTNLSYHLLKLVNSVAFAPTRKIDSFAQAIALLGRRQLQRWLQLLLYVRPQGSTSASPLLPRAALRAGLMEALARQAGQPRDVQERAFMTGMFSLLDLLLGMPLDRIIAPLGLPDEVAAALTGGDNALGRSLAAVTSGEQRDFAALAAALSAAGIPDDAWTRALVQAAGWAVLVSQEA